MVDLNGFQIPKDHLCLVSTYIAHSQGKEWNTAGGKHPLDQFWPYRFLKRETSETDASAGQTNEPDFDDPSWKFSVKGLEGCWIPFGGGPRACPGRHLTKHHMITTMAAMAMLFDIDIQAKEEALQTKEVSSTGSVAVRPKGPVPFCIRARV